MDIRKGQQLASMSGGGIQWPLVQALQAMPCLATLGERNFVVRMLIDELGQFQVDEDPRAIRHLYNIVEVCLRRPDGLAKLIDVIGRLDRDTIYFPALQGIIAEMAAEDLWPTEEREQVFLLLHGIDFSGLTALYQQIAGATAPELAGPTTYREVFRVLETLNADPAGVPKPIVFVEHLASRVRPELSIELRHWTDRQAARLSLVTELQALRRGLETDPPGPPPNSPAYLVLLLRHHGLTGDRYQLSHWHQLDLSTGWHPERGDDYFGSIDQVKRRVAELIEGVETAWARYQPEIRVEVILSSELLNLDIDQWPWEVDASLPVPVGCRYSMAVRSLERMQTGKWHRPWFTRWAALNKQISATGAIAPESGRRGESGDERALRSLIADFENNMELVSLMLSAPPQPAAKDRDEVAVALRAGIPILVWHRQDCDSEDFLATVRELLHGEGLGTVLQRTRQIRASAFMADTGHVGRFLTLLWDDPERLVVPSELGPPPGMSAA